MTYMSTAYQQAISSKNMQKKIASLSEAENKPLPYLEGIVKINRTTNFTGTCPMCQGETDIQWYEEYSDGHCILDTIHIYCNECGHMHTINMLD